MAVGQGMIRLRLGTPGVARLLKCNASPPPLRLDPVEEGIWDESGSLDSLLAAEREIDVKGE